MYRDKLRAAIMRERVEEVRRLVNQDTWMKSVVDKDFSLLLHLAAESGNVEIVKILIDNGADINALTNLGDTPMDRAIIFNNINVVELLLEEGFEINKSINGKTTPLCVAVVFNKLSIVEFLLKNGADATFKNKVGETPLHFAISASTTAKMDIVELLVFYGANIRARNNLGDTPYDLATQRSYKSIVEFFDLQESMLEIKEVGESEEVND